MERAWILFGFLTGVILILKGGDIFVDAASWIARASGLPRFVIGATIVSLATTLPEVIVSLVAASEGKTEMAIGNAIGSVTANTGLVLAASMLFMPLAIRRRQYFFQSLLLMITIGGLWLLSGGGQLTALRGTALLGILALFIWENVREAKASQTAPESRPDITRRELCQNIAKFFLGAAGIVLGSHMLVDHGSSLAAMLGVPENVIALTAIAIGTSLPELVTAVTAILKKEGALSAGNIIGANLIDTALILPLCAFVSGGALPVSPQNLALDLPVCLAVAAIAFIPPLIYGKFMRWQGVMCLTVYLAYLAKVLF